MTLTTTLALFVLGWFLKHVFFWRPLSWAPFYVQRPLFFGHRGASHLAPENTLPAYRSSVDAGLPGLEMDVLMTLDRKVVCSHNFELEHETNGHGFIDETSHEGLKNIRTGVRSHPQTVEPIPLLLEAIAVLPESCHLNIEIKTRRWLELGTALQVARWIRKGRISNPTMVSSFNPLAIWAVKWVDPAIITGFNIKGLLPLIFVNLVHPDCLNPRADLVNDDLLRFAKQRGLAVNVWTVNTRPAIKWFVQKGVEGIITDRPEYARNFLKSD